MLTDEGAYAVMPGTEVTTGAAAMAAIALARTAAMMQQGVAHHRIPKGHTRNVKQRQVPMMFAASSALLLEFAACLHHWQPWHFSTDQCDERLNVQPATG